MANSEKAVYIYTDGACKGNPGPGGWGAILHYGDHSRELKGFSPHTTNNVMELTAVIESLKALKQSCIVHVTTDSNYVKNGITDWIRKWRINGWKTASKQPVKNREQWQALDEQVQLHSVRWHWVKGHSGHPENERADELANEAIAQNR